MKDSSLGSIKINSGKFVISPEDDGINAAGEETDSNDIKNNMPAPAIGTEIPSDYSKSRSI